MCLYLRVCVYNCVFRVSEGGVSGSVPGGAVCLYSVSAQGFRYHPEEQGEAALKGESVCGSLCISKTFEIEVKSIRFTVVSAIYKVYSEIKPCLSRALVQHSNKNTTTKQLDRSAFSALDFERIQTCDRYSVSSSGVIRKNRAEGDSKN